MTTTTALDRLADAAVSARGGADLYRFALSDRIPDHAFARNSDGSVTVTGIDVLKAGTFNGLELLEADLEAMAQRFVSLRDAGIFVPPFRLDHSWSVLSVVGYFDNLETYDREDETDGRVKRFLRGDVRLTGSVDYDPAALVAAIKRGALRSRSSELGYYVTNAGVELPLVFYGCAFVDIPAVEGLAPVKLTKHRPEPHRITNLSATEGPASMDPEKIARLAALRALTSLSAEDEAERDQLEDEARETGAEIPDAPVEAGEIGTPGGDDNRAGEGTPNETATGTENPGSAAAGGDEGASTETPAEEVVETRSDDTPSQTPEVSDELAAARAEIARLRSEAAAREVARFRSAGVLNEGNEAAASTLLTHDDEEVRRLTGTLLGSLPAAVQLGRRQGRTMLSDNGNGAAPTSSGISVGMSKDEVGPLWASFTPEQRKLFQSDYDAWRNARAESGARD